MRVEVQGASLSVVESGDVGGIPVLQLCGGPGCVRYLPDAVPGSGVRAFTPDARGVGESTGGAHDVATAIADLEAIREALGLESWVVAGHSWGADLAVAYAVAHPRSVRRILAACGKGMHDSRSWSAAYHEGQDSDDPPPIPYSEEVHAALTASWLDEIRRPGLFADLARLPVPVEVVAADRDIRPSWPLAQLAELLPEATWTVIPGRHDFWFDDPDAWRRLVLRTSASAGEGS